MHDVVVAGGGPAGCSAAIHLARAGRSVLLLEQHREPKRKACGEGILPRGVEELRMLGLAEAASELGAPLGSVSFETGGRSVRAGLEGGLGLRRPLLDRLLLDAARDAGVDVRTGVTVTGLRIEDRRVRGLDTSAAPQAARAVVAADGIHSRFMHLAHLASPPAGDRFGVTAHVRGVGADAGTVRVIFAGGRELYLTPVGDGVTNVALLLRKPELARMAHDRKTVLVDLLAAEGLGGAEFVDEPMVAGPFRRASRRAWRANLVLVGDAAGFFDGITGDGISFALASGRLAAAAVDQHLAEGGYEPFRRYERERRALVRNTNLLGRLTLVLGRDRRVAALAVRNLSRQPETFQRLVDVSSGRAGLRSLRPRDLAAMVAGL